MSTAHVRRSDDFLTRVGSRITVWVLGTGLLSLHATVFTLTIIGMTFWNIYDSPNDLWVANLFRRWGVLLLFHGVAVAAGWTAWRLLRAEQQAIDASRAEWRPQPDPNYPPMLATTWQPPVAFQTTEPARPVSAFHRVANSTKLFFVAAGHGISKLGQTTTDGFRSLGLLVTGRKKGSSPEQTGSTEHVQRWPEGPIRLNGEEEAGPTTTTIASTAHSSGFLERSQPGNDAVLPINSDQEVTEPSVGKDASQTWVEAATAGWLSPRDDESLDPSTLNGDHEAPAPPAS